MSFFFSSSILFIPSIFLRVLDLSFFIMKGPATAYPLKTPENIMGTAIFEKPARHRKI